MQATRASRRRVATDSSIGIPRWIYRWQARRLRKGRERQARLGFRVDRIAPPHKEYRVSHWTILCDFDGTVSVEDITDSLLERFARPGWRTVEQAWRRGEIGSHDCMAEQVALLDASREEIDAHLDEMLIDRAFAAFVAETESAGIPLAIVSDGLDHAIRRILGSHGLGRLPIIANRLEPAGPRSWRLDFPYGSPTCRIASGNCKCACASRARADDRRVLLIGDGASDFCVAAEADLVFAKHRLIEHCRAAGIAYVPITGFADALDLLPTLIAGDFAAHIARTEQAAPA
jgi:2-hydroxy-3-keto-5-methylthiopentenyl-1-phosphate phosphatase